MSELDHYAYRFNQRPEMLAFIPAGCRSLLDVGCGHGGFGSTMRAAFPDTTLVGVEPNEHAAQAAAGYLDQVYVGQFPSALPPEERFDVIAFLDVLEHMVDPWSALRAAASHLNPDGIVVSSIPNVRYWPVISALVLRGNWTYGESGVLDRAHLRFFTRSSIEVLFQSCGYEIDRMEGINPSPGRTPRSKLLVRVIRDAEFLQFATVARPVAPRSG